MLGKPILGASIVMGIIILASFCLADDNVLVTSDGVISYSNQPLDERYLLLISEREALKRSTIPYRSRSGDDIDEIKQIVAASALRNGVDPGLMLAIAEVESNFNPNAHSRMGACGLMQLMPCTARRFGTKNIMDPKENADGAARYFRYLLDIFDGNAYLAIAAYNCGDSAVRAHGGVPPIKETHEFVDKVISIWNMYGLNK